MTKDKINLIVCDEEYKPSVFISLYESFTYTERIDGRSSWSLSLYRNSPHTDYLKLGRVILIPPMTEYETIIRPLIIKQITVSDESLTVSGTDLLWHLLSYRLAYPRKGQFGEDNFSGSAEECILYYIDHNIINPENPNRKYSTLELSPVHNPPLGNTVSINGRYQTLETISETCCQSGKVILLGKCVDDDSRTSGWHLEPDISVGVDRSQRLTSNDSGSKWVILGEGRHNARISTYEGNLDEGNMVLIMGVGREANRSIADFGGTELTAENRREIMITSSGDLGKTTGLPDWAMRTDGEKALAEAKKTSIEVELTKTDMYTRDFKLGDTISVDLGEYGHYAFPVTVAETTYDADGRTVSITVGNERNGIMSELDIISKPDEIKRQ